MSWLVLITILASPYVIYRLYVRLPQGYRLHMKYDPTSYSAYSYTVVYEANEGDQIVLRDQTEFMVWTRIIAARRARQHRRFR